MSLTSLFQASRSAGPPFRPRRSAKRTAVGTTRGRLEEERVLLISVGVEER